MIEEILQAASDLKKIGRKASAKHSKETTKIIADCRKTLSDGGTFPVHFNQDTVSKLVRRIDDNAVAIGETYDDLCQQWARNNLEMLREMSYALQGVIERASL